MIQVDEVDSAPRGHFLFVKGQLNDSVITLAAIHALNSLQIWFMKEVLTKLQAFQQGNIRLGWGDFNYIVNLQVDCSHKKGRNQTPVDHLMTQLYSLFVKFNLCYIWRLERPREHDYTYFSPSHNMYIKTDYTLVSYSLIPKV